jgi:antitoxin HicB
MLTATLRRDRSKKSARNQATGRRVQRQARRTKRGSGLFTATRRREGSKARTRDRVAGRRVQRQARPTERGPILFTATYPARFLSEKAGNGFHVRFPDLPEALTGGDDLKDTLVQAADCLAEAIAGRIARGDEIPPPSKAKRGQHLIGVPLYLAPKLALYLALRERGMPNTELAGLLGVSETVVRRMLNPKHNTKPEKIQAALLALGKRIVVTFEDAA